jgi:2-iminobutanoate/2-iminopropanoate deaminase
MERETNMMKWAVMGISLATLAGCVAIDATDTNYNERGVTHVGSQSLGGTTLPFSKAVVVDNLIFISGELGIDPETGKIVPGGTGPETTQIFKNIETTLAGLDSDLSKVVKCTVYIGDMANYAEMNAAYKLALPDPKPSRATVGVNGLAAGASLEIDCIAVKS